MRGRRRRRAAVQLVAAVVVVVVVVRLPVVPMRVRRMRAARAIP
jgi:hypothetical protein